MRILRYFRPYLASMVLAFVLLALSGALLGAVVATVEPMINKVLVDREPTTALDRAPVDDDILSIVRDWLAVERMSAWAQRNAFVQVPILIVVVYFFKATFMYFGEYLTTRAGTKIIRDLRRDLYASIVGQSADFFQAHPTGQLLSRVMNDVARLQKVATTVFADVLRVGAQVPILVALILWRDWRMSLIALVALPVLSWPLIRLSRKLRKASIRSQQTMGDVSEVLSETVGGIRVVQGFGMERFEVDRFTTALRRMLGADLKAGRASALAPAFMELFGAIIGAALFMFAGWLIQRGDLDPGRFALVLAGLALLFMSVRRLNRLNVDVQLARAATERIFAVMDRVPSIRDAPGARELPPFRESIAFEGVRFAYERDVVLDGIDVVLRKGETVALVGASGSGKSTLANLVPRFWDPTEGRVTIDGHDLREVTLASLRDQIGMVTQETVLFNDTVRRNLAYGRDDVPMERIVEAARAAHAHAFIEALPDGYDTRLGERGSRLSMGQRQRLTIARALLKDPPILILDEATSALDAESESLVQAALDRLMHGRTSLVIAHRLATVRRADRILVMDAGRVVEEGRHGELLDRDGTYAKLHRLQFEESAP